MSAFFYTATKSLATGHVIGNVYGLDLSMVDANRKRQRIFTELRSRGGATETLFHRFDVTWDLSSKPFPASLLPLVREFLDSVEGGALFTADIYGRTNRPESVVTVLFVGDGYSEPRAVRFGNGGKADYFSVSFSVRET